MAIDSKTYFKNCVFPSKRLGQELSKVDLSIIFILFLLCQRARAWLCAHPQNVSLLSKGASLQECNYLSFRNKSAFKFHRTETHLEISLHSTWNVYTSSCTMLKFIFQNHRLYWKSISLSIQLEIQTMILRQDSKRLGKFLGQWNGKTETAKLAKQTINHKVLF